MREILRRAGAHVWSEDEAIVYAASDLVAIHIGGARLVTLKLPRTCTKITELFGGEVYQNTDTLALETSGPETRLFRME